MPRLLIIGLDGVGLDLVEEFIARGQMPCLEKLLQRGTSAALTSVLPPTTLPAWTSVFTGASPSDHGIPDFTERTGYRIRFVGAGQRRLGTVFRYLNQHGLTTGTAWFPATYPPEPLNGYQISGWDSPVTHAGDDSFVHPKSLHGEMSTKFKKEHLSFDAIDEFEKNHDWYQNAAESLVQHIKQRREMAKWLLSEHPTDIAAFYFGEADTAAHHFWAFHDPLSPRRPRDVSPELRAALGNVYRELDAAVQNLIDAVGEDTPVVLVSDHGSGGTGTTAVYLNRMLEKANLLKFKKRRLSLVNTSFTRNTAPRLIPRGLRRSLFRFAGGFAPSYLESRTRFAGIDWERTIAFSEEVSYAPSIWFNQLGREKNGQLPYRDRESATAAVRDTAFALKDSSGNKIVKRVIPRRELHTGRFAHLFPDIVIELEEINGYLPACLPSHATPGEAVSFIPPAEHLGSKGRSMPGCHTRAGIFIAVGPDIDRACTVAARIEEVASWICGLLGVEPASWFVQPQTGPFKKNAGDETSKKGFTWNEPGGVYTPAEERIVAERLRRLGYLEG